MIINAHSLSAYVFRASHRPVCDDSLNVLCEHQNKIFEVVCSPDPWNPSLSRMRRGFRGLGACSWPGGAEGEEGAWGQPAVPGSVSQAFQLGKVNRVKLPSLQEVLTIFCFAGEETEVPRGTGKVSEPTFRHRGIWNWCPLNVTPPPGSH